MGQPSFPISVFSSFPPKKKEAGKGSASKEGGTPGKNPRDLPGLIR